MNRVVVETKEIPDYTLGALRAEVEKWKTRFEQYSLRLAGCGVVLTGGSSEKEISESVDYVANCPTIRAALDLRTENARLKSSHENMEREIKAYLVENKKLMELATLLHNEDDCWCGEYCYQMPPDKRDKRCKRILQLWLEVQP